MFCAIECKRLKRFYILLLVHKKKKSDNDGLRTVKQWKKAEIYNKFQKTIGQTLRGGDEVFIVCFD